MKKMVNKIENQEEIWGKMLQNCQMTNICEKLGHAWFQLSLELYGLETSQFL